MERVYCTLRIGTVAIAQRGFDAINVRPGELGLCYETYTIGADHQGASFIFEAGGYDGFSRDDLKWLKMVGWIPIAYRFQNVGQLMECYRCGLFPFYFRQLKFLGLDRA